MFPALYIALAWLLFGGSHLLISGSPLRAWLIKTYGLAAPAIAMGVTSVIGVGVLMATTAVYGHQGQADFGLSGQWANIILGSIGFAGAVLATAGILNFSQSPISVLARRSHRKANQRSVVLKPLNAIDHVTRHPFFIGIAVFMSCHALLANTLAMTVYFAGFAILSLIGIPLQDRKLRRLHGDTYGDFADKTSAIPFTAKKPNADEIDQGATRKWVISVFVTVGFLGLLHPVWQIWNGSLFIGLIGVGGLLAVIKALKAKR